MQPKYLNAVHITIGVWPMKDSILTVASFILKLFWLKNMAYKSQINLSMLQMS